MIFSFSGCLSGFSYDILNGTFMSYTLVYPPGIYIIGVLISISLGSFLVTDISTLVLIAHILIDLINFHFIPLY